MDSFLSATRWLLHKVFIILLGLTIWAFIPVLAFTINFTDAQQVKTWLSDSNTYNLLIDESLSFVQVDDSQQTVAEKSKDSNIDSQALLKAAKPVIQASFLQEQFEGAIDGTYAWLRSDTNQPSFNVSLKDKAGEIEAAVTPELAKQLAKLPRCKTIEEVRASAENIFEAKCIAPVVSPEIQARILAAQLVNDKEGPIQAEFTAEDLDLSSSDKANIPIVFNTLELMPMFFWAFLASFSVIVLLTSKTLRKGLKEVGITVMTASGLLFLASFISSRLAIAPGKYVIDPTKSDAQSQAARNIVEPLVRNITSDMASTAMLFSAIVFAFGGGVLLVSWYLGRVKQREENPEVKQDDEVPELLRDDGPDNFIHEAHKEHSEKPKMRDKIKKRLIQ